MGYTHYERLSALDSMFLEIEDATTHMHVGAVAVFDAAPLRREVEGAGRALDFGRIEALVEATLHRMPRYRQKLAWMPLTRHPVWVDDDRFNLHYHVRHTHLPPPGDERQLKRLAGRIMSQQLDRGKPLWELWLVEGLAGDRFAIVTKAHHCMIDGVGSVELMAASLSPEPGDEKLLHALRERAPSHWVPRPAPDWRDFAWGELRRRAGEGAAAASALARATTRPAEAGRAVLGALRGVGEALTAAAVPASPTPLNAPIGPHRRFDWLRFDLADVKEVKNRLGGTVNDVVLAIVTGALRRFLRRRGEDVDALDFRAMVPVNLRTAADARTPGNRITMLAARLPIGVADARERLARVID
jgi:WS/DGAT/MGAT family acyltransferase